MKKKLLILCTLFTLLDQIVKMIIKKTIKTGVEKNIISGFFYITNIKNGGGAFSILSNNTILLAFIGIICIIFFVTYVLKTEKISTIELLLYSMLIGGIIGNLIDRLFFHGVYDYLGFIFGSYYFPVFNLADIFIVVSIFTLLLMELCGDKYGIKGKKK